ncbi:MAG: alpha/beta hydrolase [Gammaproteobacteria bacterium]|nr:alpha/beta hydrolase [Gammaproteobacteria bacterium]
MKKFLKYGLGGGLLVLVLAFGGYLYWTQANRAEPAAEAIAALGSDAQVLVEDGEYVVFRPAGANPADLTGVIFYPGAACDPRGYAPVLRRVAGRGYFIVAVPMPVDMAIFAPNRADAVRASFPAVKRWVIAGHSMGGAMAAHYAHNHPTDLAGIILWDSRPAEGDTLVDVSYPVWHIHRATADGRAPEKLERYRSLFPANSTWIPVPGGIHMYFGSFVGGGYKEEWQPAISREVQQDAAVTGTLNALLAMQ